MPARVADAMRRGSLCRESVDYLRTDWFELAGLSVEEAREHFGVPAKSPTAVAVGSVGPWEPGGISEFQFDAGSSAGRPLRPPLRGLRSPANRLSPRSSLGDSSHQRGRPFRCGVGLRSVSCPNRAGVVSWLVGTEHEHPGEPGRDTSSALQIVLGALGFSLLARTSPVPPFGTIA